MNGRPKNGWRAVKGSGGHALIVDDDDPKGRTVAVAYDEKDARLLAAGPSFRRLLKQWVEREEESVPPRDRWMIQQAREALAALGEPL